MIDEHFVCSKCFLKATGLRGGPRGSLFAGLDVCGTMGCDKCHSCGASGVTLLEVPYRVALHIKKYVKSIHHVNILYNSNGTLDLSGKGSIVLTDEVIQ